MHKRLYAFMEKDQMLYQNQFGFLPKHSTSDAVIQIAHDALHSLDNNGKCLSVFLDISKTFHTISHDILKSKLSHLVLEVLPLTGVITISAIERNMLATNGPSLNALL